MDQAQLQKKVKEGYLHCRMMIEVVAVTEEATKSALEKHLAMLEKEKHTIVTKKDFKDMRPLTKPFPTVEKAFSWLVEIELLVQNLETLIYLAMNYGPSSTEIIAPDKITLSVGEAQSLTNSVAEVIHKFAQQGLGGIVVRS